MSATTSSVDTHLDRLGDLIPADRVSVDPDDLDRHAVDRWPALAKRTPAERRGARPLAVVRPHTAAEVSTVVRWAREAGLKVVPYGAGSGVVGAVVPRRPAVTVDLTSLVGQIDLDAAAATVTVPAGQSAAALEQQLNLRGWRLPHYPQSLPLATIGGLVATRSSGTFSSKYGSIEDLLVALEVVLADGTVVRTKTSPRSATGPAIAQLMVGSEGTLGIITSVTLRVQPLPEETSFRAFAFADLAGGVTAVRSLLDRGLHPAVIRLYDAIEARHLYERAGVRPLDKPLLILGFDGATAIVEAELAESRRILTQHRGDDLGPSIGQAWEAARFDASWLDHGNFGTTQLADAIEVSAAWPLLIPLHEQVLKALAPHVNQAYAHYSHFYSNGGSIYFIFHTNGATRSQALARYQRAWQVAMEIVLRCGGSISHHHGIGEARRGWIREELGAGILILRAIKRALDPDNVLNPDKLGLDPEELP